MLKYSLTNNKNQDGDNSSIRIILEKSTNIHCCKKSGKKFDGCILCGDVGTCGDPNSDDTFYHNSIC